jgi:hypothetical protein
VKNAGLGFAFDMAVDLAAQIAEVQATGWQDYSHDSHCVCNFEFQRPELLQVSATPQAINTMSAEARTAHGL